MAKCKWEKVYDAHLGENRAVNVAQLGLLGTAFAPTLLGPPTPRPGRAWRFIIAKCKGITRCLKWMQSPVQRASWIEGRKVNQTMAKIEIKPGFRQFSEALKFEALNASRQSRHSSMRQKRWVIMAGSLPRISGEILAPYYKRLEIVEDSPFVLPPQRTILCEIFSRPK